MAGTRSTNPRSPLSFATSIKKLGARAAKVVAKIADGSEWSLEHVRLAAEAFAQGDARAGLQRPWPQLAAQLRRLIEDHGGPVEVTAEGDTDQQRQLVPIWMPADGETAAHPAAGASNASPCQITLRQLSERYLDHLGAAGKSLGTRFSYQLDLGVAQRWFGEDRDVAAITRADVEAFNASDAVQRNKAGKQKSAITVAKLQRTLRLALVWAAEAGIIREAPVAAKERKAKADTPMEEGAQKRKRPARVTLDADAESGDTGAATATSLEEVAG